MPAAAGGGPRRTGAPRFLVPSYGLFEGAVRHSLSLVGEGGGEDEAQDSACTRATLHAPNRRGGRDAPAPRPPSATPQIASHSELLRRGRLRAIGRAVRTSLGVLLSQRLRSGRLPVIRRSFGQLLLQDVAVWRRDGFLLGWRQRLAGAHRRRRLQRL